MATFIFFLRPFFQIPWPVKFCTEATRQTLVNCLRVQLPTHHSSILFYILMFLVEVLDVTRHDLIGITGQDFFVVCHYHIRI